MLFSARVFDGRIAQFAGDKLSKLFCCVRNAVIFPMQNEIDVRQFRKASSLIEAAHSRYDRAFWEDRYSKACKNRSLKSRDAIADRTNRPLHAGVAQSLQRVVSVNTARWKNCQRQRLSILRLAAAARYPHERFATYKFATPEIRLVCHKRDINFVSFECCMKVNTACASQLDFDIWMRA